MQIKSIFLRCTSLFVLFVLLGTLLLTAVYCIPNSWFEANMDRSMEYIHDVEGIPYSAFFHSNYEGARIDNYTNGHMVRRALSYPHLSAFENALYGRNYARYWHGYLVFLKPLLCLGDIELIRFINILALTLLLCVLCHMLSRKLGFLSTVSLLFSLLVTWYLFVPVSIQYSSVYYILFVFSIVLMHFYPKLNPETEILLFFAAGMATSYFDLLTAPLLTLGIPLLILLSLRAQDGIPGKELWKKLVFLSAFWGIGYGAFWAAKWVLASIVLDENVVTDALKSIAMRINGIDPGVEYRDYSPLTAISENLRVLLPSSSLTLLQGGLFGLFCILLATGIFYFSGSFRTRPSIPLSRLLPLGAVCLFPFIWYSVLQNHSTIHAFFTCKNLAIPIFGLFLIPVLALGGRGKRL